MGIIIILLGHISGDPENIIPYTNYNYVEIKQF